MFPSSNKSLSFLSPPRLLAFAGRRPPLLLRPVQPPPPPPPPAAVPPPRWGKNLPYSRIISYLGNRLQDAGLSRRLAIHIVHFVSRVRIRARLVDADRVAVSWLVPIPSGHRSYLDYPKQTKSSNRCRTLVLQYIALIISCSWFLSCIWIMPEGTNVVGTHW